METKKRDHLMTAAELADYLKITVRTVMNYKANGFLPYYQLGRVLRFRKSDIDAHIESNIKAKEEVYHG